MAVTIPRTPWIDDDGSGTYGTVINNAEKTALYNQIDAALAQLAALAGGNTFTGAQAITGNLSMTGTLSVAATGPSTTHSFTQAAAGPLAVSIRNVSAGASNAAEIAIGNDVQARLGVLSALSSTFGSSGPYQANAAVLFSQGSAGLSIVTTDAAASMRFYTNTIERARIGAAGEVLINATTNPNGAQLFIVTDGGSRPNGICVQNISATLMNYFAFINSVGGVAGLIQQTGQTSVNYLTTSDGRLKDDDGRAVDVSALRAVVVHDFRWKADGARDRGVFAQEAHAHFPRAVAVGDDDDAAAVVRKPWMTDYSKFVADLIVGWQHHDAEIAALRGQLATLKG